MKASFILKFYLLSFAFVLLSFFPPSGGVRGAVPPWPSWIFTHWVWENEGTTQSARQLVDDYLAHNIPVGAIIIDSPWETGYNTFEFDTNLYPDAQQMIDYFHSKNVKVFIWITSMINIDIPLWAYADSMGYFMCANDSSGSTVINWWKGDGSLVDFFNPDAVAWWKTLMDKALAMGIDGWKCDGTDFDVFQAPYSPYLQANVTRNDYSEQYYRLFHDYSRQVLGNDRVITARPVDNYGLFDIGGPYAAFAPVDITFCGWVGDQDATFNGLKKALNNMYWSSDWGYLSFGSDIGGFRFDTNYVEGRSKELLIRWAQMGAFCPIMENGGNGEHRPWMFDSETDEIYRTFVNLHHALIPYFMEQGDTAFQQGKSLMTFFNKTEYSYMLGTDILVVPMLSASNDFNYTFPDTIKWVYLFDTTLKFYGGQMLFWTMPLDEFPVFIKEGSPMVTILSAVIPGSDELQTGEMKIYPNPANSFLTIEIPSGNIHEYAFDLIDITGRTIEKIPFHGAHKNFPPKDGSASVDRKTIAVSNLPDGIYFLKLIYDDGVLMKKIIIE